MMDAQLRLLLEVSAEAVLDAGLNLSAVGHVCHACCCGFLPRVVSWYRGACFAIPMVTDLLACLTRGGLNQPVAGLQHGRVCRRVLQRLFFAGHGGREQNMRL
jgi:hypothetical protein